jgi:hypothetical protein
MSTGRIDLVTMKPSNACASVANVALTAAV